MKPARSQLPHLELNAGQTRSEPRRYRSPNYGRFPRCPRCRILLFTSQAQAEAAGVPFHIKSNLNTEGYCPACHKEMQTLTHSQPAAT